MKKKNWIESALGLIEEVNNNMRLQLETDELPIDAADFGSQKTPELFSPRKRSISTTGSVIYRCMKSTKRKTKSGV